MTGISRRAADAGANKTALPKPTSAAVSAVMRANKKKDTKPELRLRSLLHARGYRFRTHLAIRCADSSVRPDVVFTRQRLAVFVDGCFWHSCPIHGNMPRANADYWKPKLARNAQRDACTDAALANAGWDVLRVWEHEAPAVAAARIIEALRVDRHAVPPRR